MLSRSLSLALGGWERLSELALRVRRILRWRNELMSDRLATVLTGCLILGVLSGTIALARSPQIVSFAPLAQSTMQARALPAAALRQMSIRESGSYPTLVKAVMPQRPSSTAYPSIHRRVVAPKRSLRQIQTISNPPEVVVLTEWEVAEQPPQLLLAITQDHQTSYAAVAIANGWLIVQI